MVTNIQSTDLDFESIRSSLKTYFESKDQFEDYNFEGSVLSNILDVLAWNTHFNALTSNMAINESFLETAQLRSAVVTHAQSLGYFPKSKTSAQTVVTLSVNLSSYVGTRPGTITLPSGTKFNSVVDGATYVFQTRQSYTATDNGSGLYTFVDENGSSNLVLKEGKQVTKTFLVPGKATQPVYVIPDPDLDTETVIVSVYENPNSASFESYTDIKNAIRITEASRYYLLREAPNQHYELQFGPEASFGNSPVAGNKITVDYLRVNGEAPNGARIFTPQGSFDIDGQSFSISVSTQQVAANGSDRESIEKIRFSAPLSYASQRRMVTTDDYEALIASNYNSISEVAAWGGEDADPIDYGKVYLSLLFEDDTLDSDSRSLIKTSITDDLIIPLASMSIDPVFVDPQTISLALTCRYDYNPNLTSRTSQSLSNLIRSQIQSYFNSNLQSFNGVFRKSQLTENIQNISDAILSVRIETKMVNTFRPNQGIEKAYTINFTEQIALPDNDTYTVESSIFVVNNQNVRIRNKLGSTVLQLVNSAGTVVVNRNIGSYSPNSGRISIDALNVQSLLSNNTEIKLIVAPANEGTIRPIRNYIVGLDNDLTVISPTVDYQNTRVSL
jgi:hypothetical protein